MKSIYLCIIIILVSCLSLTIDKNVSNDKKQVRAEETSPIHLPFSSSCGEDLKVIEFDSNRLKIDIPENLAFGGLIKQNENYSAIILMDNYADYQIHYLTTFNKKGKLIEKFNLFSYGCAEDEFFWGQAKYSISEDLKISQSDSSSTYKRNLDGEIIKKTIVSVSHKYVFYIDKNGRIQKD